MTFQPLYSETAGSGTTGVGTVFERRIRERTVILVSGALSEPGTTSEQPVSSYEHLWARWLDSTASAATGEAAERPAGERTATSQAISELRRISGLTWEHQLFGVSRRSVHFRSRCFGGARGRKRRWQPRALREVHRRLRV